MVCMRQSSEALRELGFYSAQKARLALRLTAAQRLGLVRNGFLPECRSSSGAIFHAAERVAWLAQQDPERVHRLAAVPAQRRARGTAPLSTKRCRDEIARERALEMIETPPETMEASEVARAHGLTLDDLHRMIESGDVGYERTGGLVYIDLVDIEPAVAKLRSTGGGGADCPSPRNKHDAHAELANATEGPRENAGQCAQERAVDVPSTVVTDTSNPMRGTSAAPRRPTAATVVKPPPPVPDEPFFKHIYEGLGYKYPPSPIEKSISRERAIYSKLYEDSFGIRIKADD